MDISVEALRAGIRRDYPAHVDKFDAVRKDMAYYGDLNNSLLASTRRTYDEKLDISDRRNALTDLQGFAARKRFSLRQYDKLPGKSALPEFVADVTAPLLGSIGLKMPLISAVSKDFAAYLKNRDGYADQARARVREKICEAFDQDEEVLLIAHGTGSVIAYDVLWHLSHDRDCKARYDDAKIDMFVTLGSPLSDNFIRHRLAGAKQKPAARFPTNVLHWRNVAAEDDYCCHDMTLADDFKKMMQQRLISAVRDYRVYNLAVRYGSSNPHSSVGYYIHPRMAKIAMDWLYPGHDQEPEPAAV